MEARLKPFLDLWRPSQLLPEHLTLTMTRRISRDEARECALGGGFSRIESTEIEAQVRIDLEAPLPRAATFTPSSSWDGVFVERVGGTLLYWFVQVR